MTMIAVWTNLPNTYNDRSESFENSSLDFFDQYVQYSRQI